MHIYYIYNILTHVYMHADTVPIRMTTLYVCMLNE